MTDDEIRASLAYSLPRAYADSLTIEAAQKTLDANVLTRTGRVAFQDSIAARTVSPSGKA